MRRVWARKAYLSDRPKTENLKCFVCTNQNTWFSDQIGHAVCHLSERPWWPGMSTCPVPCQLSRIHGLLAQREAPNTQDHTVEGQGPRGANAGRELQEAFPQPSSSKKHFGYFMVHEVIYFLTCFFSTVHKPVYFAFMNIYLFHRKWFRIRSPFPKISLGMNFLCSNQLYVSWPCVSLT